MSIHNVDHFWNTGDHTIIVTIWCETAGLATHCETPYNLYPILHKSLVMPEFKAKTQLHCSHCNTSKLHIYNSSVVQSATQWWYYGGCYKNGEHKNVLYNTLKESNCVPSLTGAAVINNLFQYKVNIYVYPESWCNLGRVSHGVIILLHDHVQCSSTTYLSFTSAPGSSPHLQQLIKYCLKLHLYTFHHA